jgi:hypothetical protein
MMALSSENTPDVATYLDSCGTKDLRNHSRRNASRTGTLIKLFRSLCSQMWSEIWSDFVYSKLARNFVSASYLTGNWKNAIANSSKEEYIEFLSSMYHFAALPMRVR